MKRARPRSPVLASRSGSSALPRKVPSNWVEYTGLVAQMISAMNARVSRFKIDVSTIKSKPYMKSMEVAMEEWMIDARLFVSSHQARFLEGASGISASRIVEMWHFAQNQEMALLNDFNELFHWVEHIKAGPT